MPLIDSKDSQRRIDVYYNHSLSTTKNGSKELEKSVFSSNFPLHKGREKEVRKENMLCNHISSAKEGRNDCY